MQEIKIDHRLTSGSIRPDRALLSTELDGGVVLMSIDRGRYYALDAVATAVWRRLDAEPTAETLIATVVSDFQGDPARIREDVLALLSRWLSEGLVRVHV